MHHCPTFTLTHCPNWVYAHNMEQKDSMTPQEAGIKRLSLRWPEGFWETVSIEATKRRTSLQALITDAVAEKLGLEIPKAA